MAVPVPSHSFRPLEPSYQAVLASLAPDLDKCPRHLGRLSTDREGEALEPCQSRPIECTVPGTSLGTCMCTHAHTHSCLSNALVRAKCSRHPYPGGLELPECLNKLGLRARVGNRAGGTTQGHSLQLFLSQPDLCSSREKGSGGKEGGQGKGQ